MSNISLRLPNSLHQFVRYLAEKEHVSINQMITLALTEKISALMTEEYLGKRAKKGSKRAFSKVLNKVSNTEPAPHDQF
ncbi:MAG: toxin-antitoxin system HicB family antitoxin [Chlamydiae bacterium]|nr:toxin-antitoxin system HicB family antitoxin [Chlamydiota bacterium]MBI3266385.1 toxin-antitoxin system HicB family antitoxin [Chlamydiota bacterium]